MFHLPDVGVAYITSLYKWIYYNSAEVEQVVWDIA